MGLVYTGKGLATPAVPGTDAIAAVQGKHNATTSAYIDSQNGPAAAPAAAPAVGSNVSAADMLALQNRVTTSTATLANAVSGYKGAIATSLLSSQIAGSLNTSLGQGLITGSSGSYALANGKTIDDVAAAAAAQRAAITARYTAAAAAAAQTAVDTTALNTELADVISVENALIAATNANATGNNSLAAVNLAQTAVGDAAAAVLAASGTPEVPGTPGTAAIPGADSTIKFDNRLQINVDASAETSSGLTFGVRSRIRINENETGALSAPRVYVKSGAVEVAVGNIYGALDSMPGMYDSEVGLTALSDAGVVLNTVGKGAWTFDNYSSQGKGVNGIEAIYSAGGFTGHLSYSEPDLSGSAAVTNKHVAAVGAYTMGDWTVALGMQDSDNNAEDKTVLTVGGKVGDYGIGFAAADNDGVQKIALNGSATFGATTVNGFVADDESGTDTALGLGVSYDLGGAAVMAGVERDAVGQTRADMGVSFSF